MRLLVVDDEVDLADAIVKGLRREGYAVDVAYDGEEALEKARLNRYDLICLDITMPRMDGEETFREMRRIKDDVPVILSSGFSEQEITQRFAGKGLAGFIQKPYRSADLNAKLRKALEM